LERHFNDRRTAKQSLRQLKLTMNEINLIRYKQFQIHEMSRVCQ
jgi:hypothetical protein